MRLRPLSAITTLSSTRTQRALPISLPSVGIDEQQRRSKAKKSGAVLAVSSTVDCMTGVPQQITAIDELIGAAAETTTRDNFANKWRAYTGTGTAHATATSAQSVLDARYERGRQSQTYLSASVLPLHAFEAPAVIYPKGLHPVMEDNCRKGLVEVLIGEKTAQLKKRKETLTEVLRLLDWLLELVEIRDYVVHSADAADYNKVKDAIGAYSSARGNTGTLAVNVATEESRQVVVSIMSLLLGLWTEQNGSFILASERRERETVEASCKEIVKSMRQVAVLGAQESTLRNVFDSVLVVGAYGEEDTDNEKRWKIYVIRNDAIDWFTWLHDTEEFLHENDGWVANTAKRIFTNSLPSDKVIAIVQERKIVWKRFIEMINEKMRNVSGSENLGHVVDDLKQAFRVANEATSLLLSDASLKRESAPVAEASSVGSTFQPTLKPASTDGSVAPIGVPPALFSPAMVTPSLLLLKHTFWKDRPALPHNTAPDYNTTSGYNTAEDDANRQTWMPEEDRTPVFQFNKTSDPSAPSPPAPSPPIPTTSPAPPEMQDEVTPERIQIFIDSTHSHPYATAFGVISLHSGISNESAAAIRNFTLFNENARPVPALVFDAVIWFDTYGRDDPRAGNLDLFREWRARIRSFKTVTHSDETLRYALAYAPLLLGEHGSVTLAPSEQGTLGSSHIAAGPRQTLRAPSKETVDSVQRIVEFHRNHRDATTQDNTDTGPPDLKLPSTTQALYNVSLLISFVLGNSLFKELVDTLWETERKTLQTDDMVWAPCKSEDTQPTRQVLELATNVALSQLVENACPRETDAWERKRGMSPFWKTRMAEDRQPEWENAMSTTYDGGERPYGLCTETELSGTHSVRYAVARGLCGECGPHQEFDGKPSTATSLVDADAMTRPAMPATFVYAHPSRTYEGPGVDFVSSTELSSARNTSSSISGPSGQAVDTYDFVELPAAEFKDESQADSIVYHEYAREVQWTPIRRETCLRRSEDASLRRKLSSTCDALRTDGIAELVCSVAISESLVDHYARQAVKYREESRSNDFGDNLALRAATKLRQLQSLTRVIKAVISGEISNGVIRDIEDRGDDDNKTTIRITRPCIRCEVVESQGGSTSTRKDVLYPIDAGQCKFAMDVETMATLRGLADCALVPSHSVKPWSEPAEWNLIQSYSSNAESLSLRNGKDVFTIACVEADDAAMHIRKPKDPTRMQLTNVLRNTLQAPQLHIAAPPEHTPIVNERSERVRTKRVPNSRCVPQDARVLSLEALHATLQKGKEAVQGIDEIEETIALLEKERKRIGEAGVEINSQPPSQAAGGPSNGNDRCVRRHAHNAQQRQSAIYEDALREVAISGDRLWIFVQQLSGTIGESVENVCVIDESALIRQQRNEQQARNEALRRASDAHFQIVRSVFGAVVRDSGIGLEVASANDANMDVDSGAGAGSGADGMRGIAGLKVFNSTVRKQAQELIARPSGEAGFFTNAVTLESLLARGTGDMTLTQLVDQLRHVGEALQTAARESVVTDDGAQQLQTPLEFLRAPRNSLFVQWKDETKAAIRRAYDTFVREMQYRTDGARQITAFELIEGVDGSLCNYFAEFCGQMLATTRMHNPSNAVYVSRSAANTAGVKARIALERLVIAATRYLERYSAPGDSRDAYFNQSGRG